MHRFICAFISLKQSQILPFFLHNPGTVELENLPLKKTALQGLELPVEVKSGFIGHLKLSIPFRHPKSEPWIININKLYLIAGPLSKHQVEYYMCIHGTILPYKMQI